jgi:hypothetical protein
MMVLVLAMVLASPNGFTRANADYRLNSNVRAVRADDDENGLTLAAKEGLARVETDTKASSAVINAALLSLKESLVNANKELSALLSRLDLLNEQATAVNYVLLRFADQSRDLAAKEAGYADKTDEDAQELCDDMAASVSAEFAKLIKDLEQRIEEARAKGQPTTSLKEQIQSLIIARDKTLAQLAKQSIAIQQTIKKQQERLAQLAYLRKAFRVLTDDPTKRTQFVTLIQKNDRTAIADFLKRSAGGGDFVISDSKDVDGVFVVFRVDGVSHCLSARLQCNGKSYSFTR